jgi:hypothetical protein
MINWLTLDVHRTEYRLFLRLHTHKKISNTIYSSTTTVLQQL